MRIINAITPIPKVEKVQLNYNQVSNQVNVTKANPYNSKSDGFITNTLFGGITGKNTAKLVFSDDPKLKPDMSLNSGMLQHTATNMGIGAAIYGSLSILKQGIGLASGKQDAAGAFANITTDIMRGGASGLGATVAGGLTGIAMKSIGATGTFGIVATFIGGMIGSSVGAGLVESTGIRKTLVEKFGSKKANI